MISGLFSGSNARRGVGFRELLVAAVLFLAGVALLHVSCLHWVSKDDIDPWGLSDFYPLSVFKFRTPQPLQLAWALVYEATFVGLYFKLTRKPVALCWVIAVALLFAVQSNLLHGWRYGIDYPTATSGDSGIEYYHDAIVIQGPLWFLRRFNSIQFELLEHARTHPPGPVLFYYALYRGLKNPGLISIAVTAISLGLGLPYWRRLLRLTLGEAPTSVLLLYAILPASLVYGLAVVDAPIAALFLATVVSFIDDGRRGSLLISAGWLSLSLFFTFGALFLLPVLLGFELVRHRRLRRSLVVLALSALVLASLEPLLGYSWLASFLRASAMENARGFLLFAEPKRYLWYRLGSVAEILCFFSPFLLWLLLRGLPLLRRESERAFTLAWLGPLSLGLVLLSGAMKIGEAARICLFILPYLLLPVVAAWRELRSGDQFRVAQAVFAWGVVMQLFGFYQW
ncbi:MAG TPA: hypothetical protein VGL19_00735 [Polyangiaceae bacterium]|jgi:voltage-gated potassium channel Kch